MLFNYITWDINPEIINIGGFSLRYYGILFATGIILSYVVLVWLFKQEKIPQENLDKLSWYAIIGIIIGARLGHCLFYEPTYYLAHPLEMILPVQFKEGGGVRFTGYQGLASHGGALGLFLALVYYTWKTKQSLIKTVDLIAVVAPLGSCFIRLANLMNSEIIGIPTDKPWAFIFKKVDDVPRHPAQLYEALTYLAIFGLMIFLYKRYRKHLQKGALFGISISLIFIARFFIEFIKEDQVAFEEGMAYNMGQLLSLPYILIGLLFVYLGIQRTRKMNAQA